MEEEKSRTIIHVVGGDKKLWLTLTPLLTTLKERYDVYLIKLGRSPNTPDVILVADLKYYVKAYIKRFPKAKVVHVDHGVSFLKYFIKTHYMKGRVRYISANKMLYRMYQHNKGVKRSDHVMGSYPKFEAHRSDPTMTKQEFMKANGLSPNGKLVLFAPTWVRHKFKKIYNDRAAAIENLSELRNAQCIVIPHLNGWAPKSYENVKVITNNGVNILDAVKHADVVVVDTSSILFEAAAHGKRIVQVVYCAYSDNPSKNYKLPTAPFVGQPFYIGKITRPNKVAEAVDGVLENPKGYDEEFMPVIKTIGEMSGTKDDTVIQALHDMITLKDEDIIEEKCDPLTVEEYQEMLGYDKFVKTRKGRNEKTGIMFGVYDDDIIKKAKKHCKFLAIGVSDNSKEPDGVDHIFVDRGYRRHYIHKYQADMIFTLDDTMEEYSDICTIVNLLK